MEKRAVLIAGVAFFGAAGMVAAADDQVTTWNALGAQAAVMAGQTVASSRTLAIEQIAVHDALNAIDPRYQRYVFQASALPGASADAAVAAAAHDALVGAIATGITVPGFGTLAGQAAAVALLHANTRKRWRRSPTALPKRMVSRLGRLPPQQSWR